MDPKPTDTQFLTIAEAAELLGVSQRTIYRWMRGGYLRYFRVGNITRIQRKDLQAFIEEYSTKGESHAPTSTEGSAAE